MKEYNLLGITNSDNNQDNGPKDEIKQDVIEEIENIETIETVTEAVKKDYNSPEKDTTIFEVMKILASVAIILFVKKYMWKVPVKEEIQIIKENNKDDIYDFKLY